MNDELVPGETTGATPAAPPAVVHAAGSPGTHTGIYPTMPEHEYHAHPALSHSGARLLLDCPARYVWRRDNPEHSDAFDFGKAAHRSVLGTGPTIVAVDADSWRTKAAQDARDEARTAGHVPLLAADVERIEAMRVALLAHPIVGRLFTGGTPEASMFWHDETGILLRARPDYLPAAGTGRRDIIPDYKTCKAADAGSFGRSCAAYGYHQQAAWYLDGWRALTGRDAAFVFVAQEKEPPYLVAVHELDTEAVDIGRARNRRAIDIYRQCCETGIWPGYPDEVQTVRLPRWAVIEHDQHESEEDNESW